MIGKFWDALFDYADKAKEEGDMRKYEICQEIEDLLQKAYDDGLKCSKVIKSHKPKTKVEELVMSIPDIKVYKDKNDGYIWYELSAMNGGHETDRFDYPEEIIKKLIEYRTNRLNSSMGEEKELMLTYISKRLREIRNIKDVLEENGEKTVVMVEGK
jgi:hypothetical protein